MVHCVNAKMDSTSMVLVVQPVVIAVSTAEEQPLTAHLVLMENIYKIMSVNNVQQGV